MTAFRTRRQQFYFGVVRRGLATHPPTTTKETEPRGLVALWSSEVRLNSFRNRFASQSSPAGAFWGLLARPFFGSCCRCKTAGQPSLFKVEPFAPRHWRKASIALQTRSERVLLKSKPSNIEILTGRVSRFEGDWAFGASPTASEPLPPGPAWASRKRSSRLVFLDIGIGGPCTRADSCRR